MSGGAILGQQLMALDQQLNSLISPPGGNNFVQPAAQSAFAAEKHPGGAKQPGDEHAQHAPGAGQDQGPDQEQKLQLSAR